MSVCSSPPLNVPWPKSETLSIPDYHIDGDKLLVRLTLIWQNRVKDSQLTKDDFEKRWVKGYYYVHCKKLVPAKLGKVFNMEQPPIEQSWLRCTQRDLQQLRL